jgi:hypothetical protein
MMTFRFPTPPYKPALMDSRLSASSHRQQVGVTSCVAAIGVLAIGAGRRVAAGSAAGVSTLSLWLVRLYIYC